MTRDLHLLDNGCIVVGPEQRDKRGKPLPRDIVVRLTYGTPELHRQILEFLKERP